LYKQTATAWWQLHASLPGDLTVALQHLQITLCSVGIFAWRSLPEVTDGGFWQYQ